MFLMCVTGFMGKQREVINSGQKITFKNETKKYY